MPYLFTDRKGGASAPPFSSFNLGGSVGDDPAAVRANRRRLAELVGARPVFMDQVHSADVRIVTDAEPPVLPATDGLVTRMPGLALVALAADCVPVLAHDPGALVVGAAHAGRNGAAAGIATRLLDAMVTLGAEPSRIEVILGPAICGRCYEVPAGLRADVDAALPGSAATTSWGTPALDLRAGIAAQLATAGVARVLTDPRCTLEDDSLFSHRRGAPTGRQAGVIWLARPRPR